MPSHYEIHRYKYTPLTRGVCNLVVQMAKSRDLTLTRVAQLGGCSESTALLINRGACAPNLRTLNSLLRTLHARKPLTPGELQQLVSLLLT